MDGGRDEDEDEEEEEERERQREDMMWMLQRRDWGWEINLLANIMAKTVLRG